MIIKMEKIDVEQHFLLLRDVTQFLTKGAQKHKSSPE